MSTNANVTEEAHATLAAGLRHLQCERFGEAERLSRHVLERWPQSATAWHLLGLAVASAGRAAEASDCLLRAARLAPQDADVWNNLGNALRMQRRFEEAMSAFQQAMNLAPNHPEALNNIGFMLHERGDDVRAAEVFREVIAIAPDFMLAHNNLAHSLIHLKKYDEALAILNAAVRQSPLDPQAYVNLGDVLRRLDRMEEAVAVSRKAIELSPRQMGGWLNLGGALRCAGKFHEALAAYDQALTIDPHSPDARWNRSLVLLTVGRLAEGWRDFEARRQIPEFAPPTFPGGGIVSPPLVDVTTSPLPARVLLIAEQGLGDTIHFLRYARCLKERGVQQIVAVVPRAIRALAARFDGVDEVCELDTEPPPHDAHCLMLSLAGLFSPSIAEIPARTPYLFPDEKLVAQWRERLAGISGVRIGIGWQGSPHHALDRHRSMPLRNFSKLAAVPGVRLLSLQRGPGVEQLAEVRGEFPSESPILELGDDVDRASGAFMDTAAIAKHLDLVITCDSALAHLCGSLGVRTWIPLAFVADWRFFTGRDDSPWYPTMRLFRQRQAGQWEPVFAEMAGKLREI